MFIGTNTTIPVCHNTLHIPNHTVSNLPSSEVVLDRRADDPASTIDVPHTSSAVAGVGAAASAVVARSVDKCNYNTLLMKRHRI